MPCDRTLKPQQTVQQRAEEVRGVVAKLAAKLANGTATAIVGKQGAIAFTGLTDQERDGVTDACAYRRIMSSPTTSALVRAKIAQAEQLAGRTVDKKVIGQGAHSHDGGRTWHDHKG